MLSIRIKKVWYLTFQNFLSDLASKLVFSLQEEEVLNSGMDIFTIESNEQKTQLKQNWEGRRRSSHNVPPEHSPTESSFWEELSQSQTNNSAYEKPLQFQLWILPINSLFIMDLSDSSSPSLKEVSPLCCGSTCTWLPSMHTLSCNSLLIPNKLFFVEEITGNLCFRSMLLDWIHATDFF